MTAVIAGTPVGGNPKTLLYSVVAVCAACHENPAHQTKQQIDGHFFRRDSEAMAVKRGVEEKP